MFLHTFVCVHISVGFLVKQRNSLSYCCRVRFWRQLDCLYRSDAENAERIRAILSDDDSTDDGTECDGGHVGPAGGDSEPADGNCFHLKRLGKVG